MLDIDQNDLRTETAKAVALIMSFAQITCLLPPTFFRRLICFHRSMEWTPLRLRARCVLRHDVTPSVISKGAAAAACHNVVGSQAAANAAGAGAPNCVCNSCTVAEICRPHSGLTDRLIVITAHFYTKETRCKAKFKHGDRR